MTMPEHSRDQLRWWSRWQIAVVVPAIFCLTVSLVTRYTVLGPEFQLEVHKVPIAKSQSADAKTQHLLSSGLQWTAPASSFTLFQPPRSSVFAASVVVPSTNLSSETWLYNRPPPSC